MTSQSLFYVTASGAIIIIAIFCIVLAILAIVVACRFAKFSRHLLKASEKIGQIAEEIKQKIKTSALIALFGEGLKEILSLVQEKKENKKSKK